MGTMNLHTRRSRGVAARIAVLLAAAVAVAPAVRAADVAAGTIITNTASAQYTLGATTEIQTATAAFTVDQLVNVTVTWQNSTDVSVLAGSVQQTLLFQLTNTGNGPDSYTLSASVQPPGGSAFSPAACQIYYDTAGTGVFASGDQLYTPGSNDPALAQNASKAMLIVCNVPSTAVDLSLGEMQLLATSKTVSGTPGTVSAGGGTGGVNAIAGLTGGKSDADGLYQVHLVNFAYSKHASVTDPSGGSSAMSGSVITYTLTVTPSGSGTGNAVTVTDPVPAHTSFVAGSLLLNGAAVTPTVGDYNLTTPGAVTVKLGNLAGSAAAQVVKFQVQID